MRPKELMQRYCDGDAASFRALYAETAGPLYAHLVMLTRDRATADDLLQETFLKLHDARAAYVRGADPMPWLFTIAHRTFLDHARRQRRARVRTTTDGEVPEVAATIDGRCATDEGEPVTPASLAMALDRAIRRLPPTQRVTIEATKLAGRPVKDVARQLGVSTTAVKLRTHRALQHLRRQFAERDLRLVSETERCRPA